MKSLALCLTIGLVSLFFGCKAEEPVVRKPKYTPPKSRYGHEYDGPKLGEMAPTFTLTSLDQKSSTNLEDFRGKRPVVLVFGSYS